MSGIYQITAPGGYVYVGETRRPFDQREGEHGEALADGNHHNPNLQYLANKHGVDKLQFKIVKRMPKASKAELLAEEQRQMFRVPKGRLLNWTDLPAGVERVNLTGKRKEKGRSHKKSRSPMPSNWQLLWWAACALVGWLVSGELWGASAGFLLGLMTWR